MAKKAKPPKQDGANLFTPATATVSPYLEEDDGVAPLAKLPEPEFTSLPERVGEQIVMGEVDPSLDVRFQDVSTVPNQNFYSNIVPHDITKWHGPHWEGRFIVGTPRATRFKNVLQLREQGLVGLYLRMK